MKKQEFYQAMEICDINNRFSDTNNNDYYRWNELEEKAENRELKMYAPNSGFLT